MTPAFKLLFFIPVLVSCEIRIVIKSGGTAELTEVFLNGSSVNIISDTERNTFKINDWQLKNALEKRYGARPDDAYLKSPTPWGDLYTRYGWDQVQTNLRPIGAKVVGMTTKPVIVTKKLFDNRHYNGSSTFTGDINQQQSNTFTSTWSATSGLSVGLDITVGFDIKILKAESTTSFSFSAAWGKETSESQKTMLGSSSGMEIALDGGQAAVAVLSATKGSLTVEVEYEATLSGDVATNFSGKYKGHHFYAPNIGSVLEAGGLPKSFKSKQLITVGFFTDDSVSQYDYATGELLAIPK